jgi:hypothetical protein
MKYSPDEAKVLRDGRAVKVHASEVVPGDIITVAVGDKIPADARVFSITSASFTVDQSLLTGESQSVSKVTEAVKDEGAVKQDMVNMLFSVSPPPPLRVRLELTRYAGNDRRQWNCQVDCHPHWIPHRHRRHPQVHHLPDQREDSPQAEGRRLWQLARQGHHCHLYPRLGRQRP